jgi:hypothetical protein
MAKGKGSAEPPRQLQPASEHKKVFVCEAILISVFNFYFSSDSCSFSGCITFVISVANVVVLWLHALSSF